MWRDQIRTVVMSKSITGQSIVIDCGIATWDEYDTCEICDFELSATRMKWATTHRLGI
jgi:hypothetical protein